MLYLTTGDRRADQAIEVDIYKDKKKTEKMFGGQRADKYKEKWLGSFK